VIPEFKIEEAPKPAHIIAGWGGQRIHIRIINEQYR